MGIAALMASAGLTHGGFYAHFANKEDLVRESVANALAGGRARFARADQPGEAGLRQILRRYLSTAHRDAPGCAAASLAAEISRLSIPTRRALADGTDALIGLVAAKLPAAWAEEARLPRAAAIFALMMGALQLARASPDPNRSQEILDGAVEAALVLARPTV